MKITMLSEIDYAGSGHKLCEAIRRHTNHNIKLFTGRYYNPYEHPTNFMKDRKVVQRRIDESDIVHLKGDFPPREGYMKLKIMHKPIIVSTSGSHFRKKYFGGYEKFPVIFYKDAVLRTAFTPDLCYPEYSDIWTPHPIEPGDIQWQRSDPPVLMHTPSRRDVKGTEFIMRVFDKLKNVNIRVLENVPFDAVIEERKKATIFFDQFKVGFYGNSAIEAMTYGIPTAAYISTLSRVQADLVDCPVISDHKKVPLWVRRIEETLDSDMDDLSIRTKQWCDKLHSYKAVAKQWDKIYNSI